MTVNIRRSIPVAIRATESYPIRPPLWVTERRPPAKDAVFSRICKNFNFAGHRSFKVLGSKNSSITT